MAILRHWPHNPGMHKLRFRTPIPGVVAVAMAACGGPAAPPEITSLFVPAAAGAMAPNMVTGPGGDAVISWLEPTATGHALRFSVLSDGEWGARQTVAEADNWFVNWADFPSVVPLSDKTWAAHWLASQPQGGYAYDVVASMSLDGGHTWSEAFTPHTDRTPTEHGFVTLFPDGAGLGMVWLDGRKMVNEYDENDVVASGMTLRSASFGLDRLPIGEALIDDLTCDCCQTDVALTAEGPAAVYRNRTTGEVRDIYVSRRVFGEWQPGVAVAADDWEIPACPVNGPVIRAKGSNVAVVWFTAANDEPRVKVAWSTDSAKSFSTPVVLDESRPLGHVGAALLDNGDLAVTWHRSAGKGGAALMLGLVTASGEVTNVRQLAEADNVFAFSVPQLAISGDDLVVAWTTEVDDEFGVRSARVPLQILQDF
jgi:hypothetical protein